MCCPPNPPKNLAWIKISNELTPDLSHIQDYSMFSSSIALLESGVNSSDIQIQWQSLQSDLTAGILDLIKLSYIHIVCIYMSNYAGDLLKSLRCMRLQDKAIQQHAE